MRKLYILHIFQVALLVVLILLMLMNIMLYAFQKPEISTTTCSFGDWEYSFLGATDSHIYFNSLPYPSTEVPDNYSNYYDKTYEYIETDRMYIPTKESERGKTKIEFSFEGIEYDNVTLSSYFKLNSDVEEAPIYWDNPMLVTVSYGQANLGMSIRIHNNTLMYFKCRPSADFVELENPAQETKVLAEKYLKEGIAGYCTGDPNKSYILNPDLTGTLLGEYYESLNYTHEAMHRQYKYSYRFFYDGEVVFFGFSDKGQLVEYSRNTSCNGYGIYISSNDSEIATTTLENYIQKEFRSMEENLLSISDWEYYSYPDNLGRTVVTYYTKLSYERAGEPQECIAIFSTVTCKAKLVESYSKLDFIKTELILGAITIGFTLVCCTANILISRRKKSTPVPTEEEQTE